jgi:integrase
VLELRKKLHAGEALTPAHGSAFRDVAMEWAAAHDLKISNEKDRAAVRQRMETHLFPFIGEKDISSVAAMDILPILQRLASRGNFELLTRVRSIASQVFRYGAAAGRCSGDPTYALRGAIITPSPRHHPSLKRSGEVGMLMRAINAYPYETTRAALNFSALTFCRPGEIRHAEWAEISGNEWRISEGKMKMRRPHIVPLARQTAELLEEMRRLTGRGRYVFPSVRAPNGGRPMSENTVLAALRSMGYTAEQMTPHGFRSMASTLLNENGFNRDWIERQLAHVEGNNVRAAYNYAEYLPERRRMMQWWADYLDELRSRLP